MPATFFDHKEAAEALARAAGFREGRFTLVVDFRHVVLNTILDSGDSGPAAMTVVSRLGVAPATEETAPHLVADLGPFKADSGADAPKE